jgi:putative addiction module component (TIGR02574 family)
MTPREEILNQALSLSPEDRAFVAAALEDSLSTTQESSAAKLLAELERRSADHRAATTSSIAAAEMLADQRRRQADETKA